MPMFATNQDLLRQTYSQDIMLLATEIVGSPSISRTNN